MVCSSCRLSIKWQHFLFVGHFEGKFRNNWIIHVIKFPRMLKERNSQFLDLITPDVEKSGYVSRQRFSQKILLEGQSGLRRLVLGANFCGCF